MENNYEKVIAEYTNEQLIYEQAIINNQYKTIQAQRKILEEEFKKRLNQKIENKKG